MTTFLSILVAVGLAYLFLLFPQQIDELPLPVLLRMSQLEGLNETSQVYLPIDSAVYLEAAMRPITEIFHGPLSVGSINFGTFNNIAPILLGKLALVIAPSSPLLVVAMVNMALLVWAVAHYRAICRSYRVPFQEFLPLLLVNPLTIFAMFTLNKEALGIFLVAGLLRYSLEGKRIPFWTLTVLSLFTRNVFFFFALFVALRKRIQTTHAFVMLIIASLILPAILLATEGAPLGSGFGEIGLVATTFDQQTSGVLTWAGSISRWPLGYLIAYPIVTVIDLFSPALNPRYYADFAAGSFNLAQAVLQVSSLMFGVVLVKIARRVPLRSILRSDPMRLAFAMTLLISAYPLSQHRYLLPIYPLLILGLTIARQSPVNENTGNRRNPIQSRPNAARVAPLYRP